MYIVYNPVVYNTMLFVKDEIPTGREWLVEGKGKGGEIKSRSFFFFFATLLRLLPAPFGRAFLFVRFRYVLLLKFKLTKQKLNIHPLRCNLCNIK